MAKAKRWALSVPIDGFALPEHADLAREAERLGYTDAWSYEADGLDCFASLAPVALATGMRLGTAIANVFTRGPATLAMSAATVADLAPGRFILGIGAGSQPIVESWNGGRFTLPATRVREMVQVVRAILAGERVVFRGKALTVDGFRLVRPPAAPVPIYVAALRPGMLRVAGEVGDGVILNWLSASDVPGVVRVVREAAAAAGRDPASIEITARLLVNVDPPGPQADAGVRRHVTAYLNVPVYRAFQEWLGRGPRADPDVAGVGAGRSQGRAGRGARAGHGRHHPARLDGRDPGPRAPLSRGGHRHRVPAGVDAGNRSRPAASGAGRRGPGAGALGADDAAPGSWA